MNPWLQKIYEFHHKVGKRGGFTLYEKARGEYFFKQIGKSKTILDLGCRDGTLTKHYLKGNQVLGADIDKQLLTKAQKKLGIKIKHMDFYDNWQFSQKFDVIVAGEVLEHLYYPEKIIKKCHQWLKPNGLFLVSVPNAYIISNRLRFLLAREVTAHHDPTHINLFSEKKLKTMLQPYFKQLDITGIAPPIYKPLHFLSNSLFADDLIAKAIK